MEEQKHKHKPVEDTSIKVDSDGMTPNEKIVSMLYAGAVAAIILAIYRIVVLTLVAGKATMVIYCTHISSVAVFATMALWLAFYGKFRLSAQNLGDLQLLNSYSVMKILSFLAGVCCILRFFSTIAYFLQKSNMNVLTSMYVLCELVLWGILAVFFFLFWNSRRRRLSWLKENDFNTRLKM